MQKKPLSFHSHSCSTRSIVLLWPCFAHRAAVPERASERAEHGALTSPTNSALSLLYYHHQQQQQQSHL